MIAQPWKPSLSSMVAAGSPHELSNGILLRSDLHRRFDLGYLIIDPGDDRIMVSRRIREEFENGRDYYRLHGQPVAAPADPRWFRVRACKSGARIRGPRHTDCGTLMPAARPRRKLWFRTSNP
jgi:hypothetical protein